jgi:hypothetical protein
MVPNVIKPELPQKVCGGGSRYDRPNGAQRLGRNGLKIGSVRQNGRHPRFLAV